MGPHFTAAMGRTPTCTCTCTCGRPLARALLHELLPEVGTVPPTLARHGTPPWGPTLTPGACAIWKVVDAAGELRRPPTDAELRAVRQSVLARADPKATARTDVDATAAMLTRFDEFYSAAGCAPSPLGPETVSFGLFAACAASCRVRSDGLRSGR